MAEPGFEDGPNVPPNPGDALPPAPPVDLPPAPPVDLTAEGPRLRQRPRLATTASVLLIVFGSIGVFLGIRIIVLANAASSEGSAIKALAYIIGFALLVLNIANIIAGIFLLRGQEWARATALATCGLIVALDLVALLRGGGLPTILGIALYGGIFATAMRPDVREWCS